MPAAAVTPAPGTCVNVVAVKKLVVGCVWRLYELARQNAVCCCRVTFRSAVGARAFVCAPLLNPRRAVYFEKMRVLQAAESLIRALNHAAWDNGTGSCSAFRWFLGAR